jgi:hypothetical protein
MGAIVSRPAATIKVLCKIFMFSAPVLMAVAGFPAWRTGSQRGAGFA